jgi:AcrR family transcriptional regulator
MTEPSRRHARRPPQEVRALILEAAHRLFTEHGYHGTKTRVIAEAAEVGESVVFRNFGSKAELFQAAILMPFTDFLSRWAASWDRRPPASSDPEEITRSFVKGFYGFASEHRELLLVLIAAQARGGDPALAKVATEMSERFADGLGVMRRVLLSQGKAREYDHLDPPVTVAVAVGSVLSVILLADWLFPTYEKRPSKARQIEELTQLLLHGVSGRA